MIANKKSLFDWRFKLGVFFLVLVFIILVIFFILMPTVSFINHFNIYLGNGFWALHHYGLKNLLFNWESLNTQAIIALYFSHPFLAIFIALILLLFVLPIFLVVGCLLIIRWWIKTRI